MAAVPDVRELGVVDGLRRVPAHQVRHPAGYMRCINNINNPYQLIATANVTLSFPIANNMTKSLRYG